MSTDVMNVLDSRANDQEYLYSLAAEERAGEPEQPNANGGDGGYGGKMVQPHGTLQRARVTDRP